MRFLLVWLIAPLVALELLSNKPPLYTVQALFPAGALLVALAIAWIEPYQRPLRAMPGMFWGTTVLLVVIAPVLLWGLLWITDTPLTVLLAAGFVGFAGLFIYAAWVSAHGYGMAWFSSAVLGTVVLGLWFNGLLMPGLKNFWTAPQIAAATAQLRNCTAGPIVVSGFREPSLALAVSGRAEITSPEAAAARIASGGAAIIESQQFDRFTRARALDKAAPKMRRLGCIRTFNLARGCSLLFEVHIPAGSTGVQTSSESCQLALAQECRTKHEVLRSKLKIKHCG